MDRRVPSPVLTPTGSSGRLPAALVLVAALAVLALVVKPWGMDDPRPPPAEALREMPSIGRPPPAVRDAARDPARPVDPAAAAAADLASECLDPLGWRVYTLARWGRGTVRIWSAAAPVDAAGPSDPAIPFVPVVADAVLGLGYCAPVVGPDRPAPTVPVALWRLGPDGPRPLTPGRLRPRSYTNLGALYGPPAGAVAGSAAAAPAGAPSPAAAAGAGAPWTAETAVPSGAGAGPPTPAAAPLVPAWPSGRYVFDVGGRWFGASVVVGAAGGSGSWIVPSTPAPPEAPNASPPG